jgi:hypothetical protein
MLHAQLRRDAQGREFSTSYGKKGACESLFHTPCHCKRLAVWRQGWGGSLVLSRSWFAAVALEEKLHRDTV